MGTGGVLVVSLDMLFPGDRHSAHTHGLDMPKIVRLGVFGLSFAFIFGHGVLELAGLVGN